MPSWRLRLGGVVLLFAFAAGCGEGNGAGENGEEAVDETDEEADTLEEAEADADDVDMAEPEDQETSEGITETCFIGRDVVTVMGTGDLDALGEEFVTLTRQANRIDDEDLRAAADEARAGYAAARRGEDRGDLELMGEGLGQMTDRLRDVSDICAEYGIEIWPERSGN